MPKYRLIRGIQKNLIASMIGANGMLSDIDRMPVKQLHIDVLNEKTKPIYRATPGTYDIERYKKWTTNEITKLNIPITEIKSITVDVKKENKNCEITATIKVADKEYAAKVTIN